MLNQWSPISSMTKPLISMFQYRKYSHIVGIWYYQDTYVNNKDCTYRHRQKSSEQTLIDTAWEMINHPPYDRYGRGPCNCLKHWYNLTYARDNRAVVLVSFILIWRMVLAIPSDINATCIDDVRELLEIHVEYLWCIMTNNVLFFENLQCRAFFD